MDALNRALVRFQPFIAWFQRVTHGWNWYRLAFLFIPAFIRGDLKFFGFYLPFIFGPLLKRVVDQFQAYHDKKEDVKVQLKISLEDYVSFTYSAIRDTIIVWIFLAFCYWNENDTRVLGNFYLSSFLVPMIRICFPKPTKGPLKNGIRMWDTTWGEVLAHVFIFAGLIASWKIQGMDQLFLGFLFLLAIPTIQDRFWWKPTQHFYLICAIMLVCLPFLSVGISSRFFPTYLEYFPKSFYRTLCIFANARPRVKDYYAVLGVSQDTDMKTIKRIFRQLSVELHPDKVGDDKEKLARFHSIREASDMLTKKRAQYDKAIENQEQDEMAPRCEMFMYMMHMWIVYTLLDWVQVEDTTEASKKALKNYIMNERELDTRINLDAIGIGKEDEEGKQKLRDIADKHEADLPVVQGRFIATGNREDIMAMRALLRKQKVQLKPFPEVKGTLRAVQQQVVIEAMESEPLNAMEDGYKGWTATVEAVDILTSSAKSVTLVVARHQSHLGLRHVLTFEENLGMEPEMGYSSCVSLAPPKGSSLSPVKAKIGWHLYPERSQVLVLGESDPSLGDKDMPKLAEEDNFYSGYKLELWNDKTLVGYQRVYVYDSKTKTVILKRGLVETGGGDIEPGKTTYKIFPDQLLPQDRDSYTPNDLSSARGA